MPKHSENILKSRQTKQEMIMMMENGYKVQVSGSKFAFWAETLQEDQLKTCSQ